jgi:RNA polymerase sigma factor
VLIERINAAKNDNAELDRLISDYMPFIRRAASESASRGLDYDDRLSLAMIAFTNCVKRYDTEKGGFAGFAAARIRSRLVDEGRRQARYSSRIIPLYPADDDGSPDAYEGKASVAAYDIECENDSLTAEIDALSGQLADYGIAFAELPEICPKRPMTTTYPSPTSTPHGAGNGANTKP